jgi:hypothetical protein
MAAPISRRWRALLLAIAFIGTGTAPATAASADPIVVSPPPILPGPVQPVPARCSSITSFSPATARPGQQVDISIAPGPNIQLPSYITGVTFADSVPARSVTVVAYSRVLATVPVGASAGHLRVSCRSALGGTSTAESTSDFSPIPFGLTVTPATATRQVGQSVTASATLSHSAPEAVTLSLAPSSTALSIGGQPPGQPLTMTIPAGQQSIGFSVTAHSAGGGTVTVSGHNVAPATLTVSVPTPWFSITGTIADADVHWGQSAPYRVTIQSGNGFAGPVTLTAQSLPQPGAAATPVVVNVPANGTVTGTLDVTTVRGGVELGRHTITVRAASPGYPNSSRTTHLRVLPAEESFTPLGFTDLTPLMADVTTACDTRFDAVYDASAGTIRFRDSGTNLGMSLVATAYAFTKDGATCRGAVVIGPPAPNQSGASATIVNLGFDNQISDGIGARRGLLTYDWNQPEFKVSGDASLLIAVSGDGPHHATLWNLLEHDQITPRVEYPSSLSARVVGAVVEATRPGALPVTVDWTL